MENNLQQNQRQEQNVVLTPAQQRNLEILQKPVLELQKYLEEQVAQNPLLDVDENQDEPRPENIGESLDDDLSSDENDDFAESESEQAQKLQQRHDFILNSEPDTARLGEDLLNNARLDASSPKVVEAFEQIIEHLDSRGFLPENIEEMMSEQDLQKQDIADALKLLHESEPAGIGARNLRECFLIQLEKLEMRETLAYRVVADDFDLFMKRKVDEIAERENRSISDVENAIATLAKLNSSPAHEYTVPEENELIADVKFFKKDDTWQVELTNLYIPKLRVNSQYRQMMAEGSLDNTTLKYVKEKIDEAKSLIDAIKQRQNTTLKIARAILKRQGDFFENARLSPMTRQDIASDIAMHASTIGRAISGKNAETPFGIIPLKNFFSNSLENDSGEEVSTKSIKEKIADIVASEDPASPHSDAKIAELLAQEGLTVARRTVAKYREELNIPSKIMRKRF